MKTVLDASAILALVLHEDGSSKVVRYLDDGLMSSINLAEVLSRLAFLGTPVSHGARLMDHLQFKVVPFTSEHAEMVGALRVPTVDAGLSLGDRACIALGQDSGRPIVTADRVWTKLELGVQVISIR